MFERMKWFTHLLVLRHMYLHQPSGWLER